MKLNLQQCRARRSRSRHRSHWADHPAPADRPRRAQTATRGDAIPALPQWAMMAAAIAAGLSTLAAGYAVAVVGSAAVGALAEKPELLGRVLILVGLAEGIAIYGLIVAV